MNVYLVTGQIATGKSYFTNIISKKGYKFFCADNFVGELYKDKNIIESIKDINKEL
jgi:dephospho-CoA kinase